jgi:hypothetical protein
MQHSRYLAKLIGPVFVAVGVGMLLNTHNYLTMAQEGLHSPIMIYFSGVLLLTAGIAIVLTHNLWVGDWRLNVTLLGWLATIGGLFRILWPQKVMEIGSHVIDHDESLIVGGFIVLVIGCVLGYFGYADTPAKPRRKRGRK